MDVNQYMELFIEESREHLQNLNDLLLKLELDINNKDIINEIFRSAHTLKGMAGTMGFKGVQGLTHNMENVLSEIRNDKVEVNSDVVDLLFQCLDVLESYVDSIVDTNTEGKNDSKELVKKLEDIASGNVQIKKSNNSKSESTGSSVIGSEKENFITNYNEFEVKAIKAANDQNLNVMEITIYISENCILKSARAFVLFRTLESMGQIIKSVPEVQEIEDEKFDNYFSVCLISSNNLESVKHELEGIAEVSEVIVKEVNISNSIQEIKNEVKDKANSKNTEQETKNNTIKKKTNRTVRVDIDRLDKLMNLVSELIIIKNGLETVDVEENQNYTEFIEYLERTTTNMHDAVMKVRMVPIESVFNRFPRMIRDLSRKLNKEIILHMSGEDTELDRTVIDEIGDPLVHLLRNAADHGLETTEERIKANKSKDGHIILSAYQDGNNVVIEVKDDGKGIDVEKIREKAINKSVIEREAAENMKDKDIIDLLFQPSFSTADKISDVSGRGVGLDVVKTNIETLGGEISVKTKLGEGSRFVIRLPLTLAIIQALMVEIGDEKYAIPLSSINTIEDVKKEDIKYVQSNEVVHLRGDIIPIVYLREELQIESDVADDENKIMVVVSKGERKVGFIVDNLIGQQEIVIKSLGKSMKDIKEFAGATILGNGEVALILDVNYLIQ